MVLWMRVSRMPGKRKKRSTTFFDQVPAPSILKGRNAEWTYITDCSRGGDDDTKENKQGCKVRGHEKGRLMYDDSDSAQGIYHEFLRFPDTRQQG
jgi:hypothetical protein